METTTSSNQNERAEGAKAAQQVMRRHVEGLNRHDSEMLATTLHFPHYRLSDDGLKMWDGIASYFADFRARAGQDWHHTVLKDVSVIAASAEKVHLDVWFDRCRADDSIISTFRSLWIIVKRDGHWAAVLRSSFAPDKRMLAEVQ